MGKNKQELSGAVAKKSLAKWKSMVLGTQRYYPLYYFIWHELQVQDNLSQIHKKAPTIDILDSDQADNETSKFIHNEIREQNWGHWSLAGIQKPNRGAWKVSRVKGWHHMGGNHWEYGKSYIYLWGSNRRCSHWQPYSQSSQIIE